MLISAALIFTVTAMNNVLHCMLAYVRS